MIARLASRPGLLAIVGLALALAGCKNGGGSGY